MKLKPICENCRHWAANSETRILGWCQLLGEAPEGGIDRIVGAGATDCDHTCTSWLGNEGASEPAPLT